MKVSEGNSSIFVGSAADLDPKTHEKILSYSEETQQLISENKSLERVKTRFWAGLAGVYLVSLANLVLAYSDDKSIQPVFYVFISTSLVSLPISVLCYKRQNHKSLFLLFCIFSLHLIFTDATVYSGFNSSTPAKLTCLQLQTFSLLIFAPYLSRICYAGSAVFFCLLALVLLISTHFQIRKILLDFSFDILFIMHIYFSTFQKSTSDVKKNGASVTPLEEILDLLNSTVENLKNIGETCGLCRAYIEVSNENLSKIVYFLMHSKNIYSTQLEKITKNMDAEDKVFIEQIAQDQESPKSFSGPLRRARSEIAVQMFKLEGVLKLLGKDWNFDSFFLRECSEGSPLEVAGLYTLARYKLDSIFEIKTAEPFLKDLESKYLPNPYHNSCHATDVMSSFLYLLSNSDLFSQCNDLELLAGILSTLGHDVGHPAKNNRFLVITKDEIAIQYNDISVLENMHSTILFQLIQKNSLLDSLKHDQWCLFRKLTVEMVLSTDMSKHFDILESFKTKYLSPADFTKSEVKFDLFKMIIKASDIGHAAKNIGLHRKWCELVIEEFYSQGDLEKTLGLEVSMYCNRETTNIGKSQSGFIKNIVFPLFLNLNSVLASKEIEVMCVDQLEENQKYWENYNEGLRKHTCVEKIGVQYSANRRRSSLPPKQNNS